MERDRQWMRRCDLAPFTYSGLSNRGASETIPPILSPNPTSILPVVPVPGPSPAPALAIALRKYFLEIVFADAVSEE